MLKPSEGPSLLLLVQKVVTVLFKPLNCGYYIFLCCSWIDDAQAQYRVPFEYRGTDEGKTIFDGLFNHSLIQRV